MTRSKQSLKFSDSNTSSISLEDLKILFEVTTKYPLDSISKHIIKFLPESCFKVNEDSYFIVMDPFVWAFGEIPHEMIIELSETGYDYYFVSNDTELGDIEKFLSEKSIAYQIVNRHRFSAEELDRDELLGMSEALDSEFRFKELGSSEIKLLMENPRYFQSSFHVKQFRTEENFKEFGFGVGLYDSNGDLIGAASTAAVGRNSIEVQIDIFEEFRRKGLAKFLGAKFLLMCMDKNMRPDWDAANEVSKKLAITLGYKYLGNYKSIWLMAMTG